MVYCFPVASAALGSSFALHITLKAFKARATFVDLLKKLADEIRERIWIDTSVMQGARPLFSYDLTGLLKRDEPPD